MTCTVCGKPYPCAHSRKPPVILLESQVPVELEPLPTSVEAQSRADQQYWRDEVISRVRQHRARRRRRCDASLSLELDFPADSAPAGAPMVSESQAPAAPDESVSTSDHALRRARPAPPPVKIIRFPRHSGESRLAVEDLQLAEPVRDTPRILDIPEDPPEARQMELLPSFADIRFDEDEAEADHGAPTKPGGHLAPGRFLAGAEMELPLQPAGLQRRFLAGLLDAVILLAGGAVFGTIFSRLAGHTSISRPGLLCALGAAASLWVLFQYVFLVYGGRTPGMYAAGLELYDFNSRPAAVNARRWRALAAALSGLSLGLGFAWALVDEDTLGWHDRISQTYVRRSS